MAAANSQLRLGDGSGPYDAPRTPIGDYTWLGNTYRRADASISPNDGNLVITGQNGGISIPWEKAPWDLKKKMETARVTAIAEMKARPRISASPEMLILMWGKPTLDKTAITGVGLLKFETPEYRIDAHCDKTRALMMEIERKAGWTKESNEAVLLTMEKGAWRYDVKTELWACGSTKAKMINANRLRVMSGQWNRIANGETGNGPASGL